MLIDTLKDMPDQTDLANEILKSALNGSRLTRRLLAVGRNQPLRPQRVNLSLLLSGEIEMLRRTLGELIHVVAVSAPDLWFTSADPSQIGDALLNLALNARDAMPHGERCGSQPPICTWMRKVLPGTASSLTATMSC